MEDTRAFFLALLGYAAFLAFLLLRWSRGQARHFAGGGEGGSGEAGEGGGDELRARF